MDTHFFINSQEKAMKAFLDMINAGVSSRHSLDEVLKKVGEHYQADRAYIFEKHESGRYITNTFEWCKEGIQPGKGNLQHVPIGDLKICYTKFRQQGTCYIRVDEQLAKEDPHAYDIFKLHGISALLVTPLISSGKIVGLFGVDNPRENTEHFLLLSVIATAMYHDLQDLRIIERKEKYVKKMQELNRELDRAARKQEEQLRLVSLLSNDYLNVYLIRLKENIISIVKLDGYITEGLSLDGPPEYPYDAACAKYIHDRVYKDDVAMMKKVMSPQNLQEKLAEGKSYAGVYRVLDKGEIHYYQFKYGIIEGSDQIIAGFQNVDEMIASEKAQQERLQAALDDFKEADYDRRRDFLTGLRNRQDMFEMMQDVLSGRRKKICAAFMMDIDNFKLLNDHYGHSYGDECLKKIGAALNEFAKKEEIFFYRYGGEEILGISFGTAKVADELAAFLVELVYQLDIKRDDCPEGRVTVSLGYTTNNRRYEKMIDKADMALYRAKELGKNRAVCFEKM